MSDYEKDILTRIERLEAAVFGTKDTPAATIKSGLDFDLPERAFIKKYSAKISGPKKFTLLVAFYSKGSTSEQISLKEIEKGWNKMTSILGGKFNRFYSNTAKTNGWVDSKNKGYYQLTSLWKEILGSGDKDPG